MTLVHPLRPAHLPPGTGRQLRVITDLVTIKMTAAESGGAYALVEAESPPGGGIPRHLRRYDDATLCVLDGTYTLLLGEDMFELGPGGYVFVPRGTSHGYVNAGIAPARMLLLTTPGGVQERFLEEIADHASRMPWEPDMARLLAVAPKYGVEFPVAEASGEAGGVTG